MNICQFVLEWGFFVWFWSFYTALFAFTNLQYTVKPSKIELRYFDILAHSKYILDTLKSGNRANLWSPWGVSFTCPKLMFERNKMTLIILEVIYFYVCLHMIRTTDNSPATFEFTRCDSTVSRRERERERERERGAVGLTLTVTLRPCVCLILRVFLCVFLTEQNES